MILHATIVVSTLVLGAQYAPNMNHLDPPYNSRVFDPRFFGDQRPPYYFPSQRGYPNPRPHYYIPPYGYVPAPDDHIPTVEDLLRDIPNVPALDEHTAERLFGTRPK